MANVNEAISKLRFMSLIVNVISTCYGNLGLMATLSFGGIII